MDAHRLASQGWCQDPSGRHRARWFSGGLPTCLVRDGSIESRDPVPAVAPSVPPAPIYSEPRGDDMKRADMQDEATFNSARVTEAVFFTIESRP
jgi:hypothetical protein